MSNTKSEIKSWLQTILQKDNIKDISVEILGNSEKGDGYVGDIFFVYATGNLQNGTIKEYNLVLKCSKRSQILRENSPVKEAFLNEIYIYDTLLPAFNQFQKSKGIDKPFNSVPKCYGTFTGSNMEVIVFENLKKIGYFLWDKKTPLTRKHINMVVREYGKFHAISVAMQDQEPQRFEEIAEGLTDAFTKFVNSGGMVNLFATTIQEAYDELKNEFDESVLVKWRSLKEKVEYIFTDMYLNFDGLKVINHGDCWNNNFMFYSDIDDKNLPSKVAILDWQISRPSSPVYDLSYFLFSCISEEDLQDMDIILEDYYQSFSKYVRMLGSNPEILFPKKMFLNDWKQYSKYGIVLSTLLMKICSTDKDEVPDITEAAEKGKDFCEAFLFDVKDKTGFRNRMRYIVKHAVEKDLV